MGKCLAFSPCFQNRDQSPSNHQAVGPEAILGILYPVESQGCHLKLPGSIRFHPYPGHVPRENGSDLKETKTRVSQLPFVFISASFLFICSFHFQFTFPPLQFRPSFALSWTLTAPSVGFSTFNLCPLPQSTLS